MTLTSGLVFNSPSFWRARPCIDIPFVFRANERSIRSFQKPAVCKPYECSNSALEYCSFRKHLFWFLVAAAEIIHWKSRLSSCVFCFVFKRRDSSVGIATGYGLDDRGIGVRVPVGSRIFSSPQRPYRHWGPLSLLSNGYRGLFPRFKATGAWSWPLTSN
jgi:hypothetical protein